MNVKFYCSAERVAKNCTKIKTVSAAACCAKHTEIISLWRFFATSSSLRKLRAVARFSSLQLATIRKRAFDLSLTAFGQHTLHLPQIIVLK